MFDAFLTSKKFQEALRTAVLDTLRTPGGPGAPDQGHPERAGESAEVMCGGERGGGS